MYNLYTYMTLYNYNNYELLYNDLYIKFSFCVHFGHCELGDFTGNNCVQKGIQVCALVAI